MYFSSLAEAQAFVGQTTEEEAQRRFKDLLEAITLATAYEVIPSIQFLIQAVSEVYPDAEEAFRDIADQYQEANWIDDPQVELARQYNKIFNRNDGDKVNVKTLPKPLRRVLAFGKKQWEKAINHERRVEYYAQVAVVNGKEIVGATWVEVGSDPKRQLTATFKLECALDEQHWTDEHDVHVRENLRRAINEVVTLLD